MQHSELARLCRVLNVALWVVWLGFLGYAVLVVMDPTGIGGVQEADGLEGVGLILALLALPLVIALSIVLAKLPRWRAPDSPAVALTTPRNRRH